MDDPSPKVSSLYGPGAFVGWLCTLLFVLVSWACNRQIIARDTIGNDLIAALALPSIAAIHYHYESAKAMKKDVEPAIEVLDATSCFAVWFLVAMTFLLFLATAQKKLKRFICIGIFVVLCLSVTFSMLLGPRHLLIKLRAGFGVVPFAVSFFLTFLFLPCLAWMGRKDQYWTERSALRTAGTEDQGQRVSSSTGPYIFGTLFLTAWVATGVCLFSCNIRKCKGSKENCSEPGLVQFAIPETGYAITELDQAVALGAGLLTVTFSTFETFMSRRLGDWERYHRWRLSCETLPEEGILQDDVTTRLKEMLRKMEEQERKLLCAPDKTKLLATLLKIKRKLEAERITKIVEEDMFGR